jgi:hypothetical protein
MGANNSGEFRGNRLPYKPSELIGVSVFAAEALRAPMALAKSLPPYECALIEDNGAVFAQVQRPSKNPVVLGSPHEQGSTMRSDKLRSLGIDKAKTLLSVAHIIVVDSVGKDILRFDELTPERYSILITAQHDYLQRMVEESANDTAGVMIYIDDDGFVTVEGRDCEVPAGLRNYAETHNLDVQLGTLGLSPEDIIAGVMREEFEG